MAKCYAMAGEVFGMLNEWKTFGELSMYTRFFGQSKVIVYEWSFSLKKDRYRIAYSITTEELESADSVETVVERIKYMLDADIQGIKASKLCNGEFQ